MLFFYKNFKCPIIPSLQGISKYSTVPNSGDPLQARNDVLYVRGMLLYARDEVAPQIAMGAFIAG